MPSIEFSELIYRQTKAVICFFNIKITILRFIQKFYHKQLSVKIANDYNIQQKILRF